MTKSWSINQKKKFLVEFLQEQNFQEKSREAMEITQALRLDPNSTSPENTIKDQIAAWVIQNYSLIKTTYQNYFNAPDYQTLSNSSKKFLIQLIKAYSKKNNELNQTNDMYMPKVAYGGGYPYNYMYPSQPYGMNPPSMMYPPPHPSYYNNGNNQAFQKMYRQQLQYYMQMQQMPINYPPYMSGYNMNPQYGNQIKSNYPVNNNPMIPEQNNFQKIPSQPISQPQSNNTKYAIDNIKIPKQASNTKDLSCSTRSVQDYEQSFKRYYDLYGKNLGKEAPFIIIPPSKQKKNQNKKSRVQPSYQKKKVMPSSQKNQSSDLQILQVPKQNKIPQKTPKDTSITPDKNKLNQANKQLSQCLCKGFANDPNTFTCTLCFKKFHYECLKKTKNPQVQSQITCPFCFMRYLDPLNSVIQQIRYRYAENISQRKLFQFFNFQNYDSYIMNQPRGYEIQVRCMRLQDAVNQIPEYTWPDQCLVLLNNQKAIQFPALQLHSSVKKRKDSSVFLTYKIFHDHKNIHQRKNSRITVQVKPISANQYTQKKIRNQYTFIIGFYLTKKKTVDQLYDQIAKDTTNKVQFAKNYFNEPQQEEIAIQQIKVNLSDPFTWNLIQTPARGIRCVHGQCFDLKTYISFMNVQRNRSWKCPVCSRECRKFVIDSQQINAIEQYKRNKDQQQKQIIPEVVFHRDGRIIFCIQSASDEQNQQVKSPKNPVPQGNVNEIE